MPADIARSIEEIKESVGQLARAVNERGLGTVPELGEVAQRVGQLADAVTSQSQETEGGNGASASERSRRQQLQEFYDRVYNDTVQRVNGARNQVEDFVRDNPLRSILYGICGGLAVGFVVLLGRRR